MAVDKSLVSGSTTMLVLKLLEEKYIIDSMRLFDMFGYTSSVECVCILRMATGNKEEK